MARIQNSFFAGLSGKISNVVISSWRGIPVLKSAPNRRRKIKASKAQLIQREKLKIVSSFLKKFGHIINFGFEPLPGQSARSQAQQIAMREAIRGEYPDFSIDLSRVLITRGSLKPPSEVVLTSPAPGQLRFQWKNKPDDGSDYHDKAVMAILVERIGRAMHFYDGNARLKEETVFESDMLPGQTAHCWIAFRSVDGLLKSDSVYAGEIVVEGKSKF